MSENRKPLLQVEDINVYYGAIHAIKGISFEVFPDEIVTLIGANGAGKSTTLNTIAGLLRPVPAALSWRARTWQPSPPAGSYPRAWPCAPRGGASSSR